MKVFDENFPGFFSRTSQNRERRPFELTNLPIVIYLFIFKWAIVSLDKTLIHRLGSFKALWKVCTETVFSTLNRLVPIEIHYMEKNPRMFSSKKLNFFLTEERTTWISWMTWGWVNYQQKFFFFFLSELLL